jgi:hypothetical protein
MQSPKIPQVERKLVVLNSIKDPIVRLGLLVIWIA